MIISEKLNNFKFKIDEDKVINSEDLKGQKSDYIFLSKR